MARDSFVQLAAQLLVSFPDNISGAITPAVLRDYFMKVFDTLRPASANINRVTSTLQVVNTVDAPLVFDAGFVSDVPDFVINPASGIITRLAAGSTRLIFNATIEGPNGRTITVTLYKNGIVTNRQASITLTGPGNPIAVSATVIDSDASLVDYQLRVKSNIAGTNANFGNMILYADVLPVNS